ncbi:MAG: outer membrane protein assembly factor BamA [Steroidobacterales bacterium]
MISRTRRAKWRALLAALAWLAAPLLVLGQQSADGDFVVRDIHIEGLQRISEGTVFNYLPVNIGDHLTAAREREALRALYATGFFRDVELRRDGDTLIVAVLERPSLESIDIKGNKDIKTEDLQKSLRNVGLAAGKTFDRSTLDEVTQYLTDQYYSRGKYAVQIDTKVEDLPDNRVRVNINIKEGSRAKIRQINIVGNTKYKDKEILQTLQLQTPNWTSWYKESDRYSRESLQGDLEKITAWYQDRGYANFRIDSAQVAVAPDKSDIFITVNVTEGQVYRLGEIKVAGNTVVPESELHHLLLLHSGQIYSQKAISATQEAIKNRLGAEGFYFAKVEPVPSTDDQKKIVDLTLFVDPGSRVYVRHINFTGTTRSNDETLRRELRQLEGSWLSNVALERSKQRLQRDPFIESVEMSTEPVPGVPDLVDVNFAAKERPSATVGGGIGYSASQGFVLNGNFSDSDFFGGGNYVALNIDAGKYNKVYSFSQTDPYRTVDNLSRTISLSYRDSTQFTSQTSAFGSKNLALGLTYGYPISEYQGVSAGVSLQHVDLLTYNSSSAQQAVRWVQQNGNPYTSQATSTFIQPDGSTTSFSTTLLGSRYDTVELTAGWQYDSRNRSLFADRGMRHALSFSVVPPVNNVRYWLASYEFSGFLPIWHRWVLTEAIQIAFGHPLGGTIGMPPYKRFYAGGPDTVRGYTEDTLGPVDTNGNPYGGNLLTVARTELIVPLPEKWQTSARGSLFFDMGNVFSTDGTTYVGEDLATPVDYKFSYHALKQGTGVAVQWLAPSLGIFRFSYGIALNPARDDGIHFADRTEGFQFSIGQSF